MCVRSNQLFFYFSNRGVANGGGGGGGGWGTMRPHPFTPSPLHPISIFELNKVQKFHFQTLGILFLMDVQKLYGPRISQFLPCMLQFLDNLWRLFICSNYIGEEDHFTLEPLKRFDT